MRDLRNRLVQYLRNNWTVPAPAWRRRSLFVVCASCSNSAGHQQRWPAPRLTPQPSYFADTALAARRRVPAIARSQYRPHGYDSICPGGGTKTGAVPTEQNLPPHRAGGGAHLRSKGVGSVTPLLKAWPDSRLGRKRNAYGGAGTEEIPQRAGSYLPRCTGWYLPGSCGLMKGCMCREPVSRRNEGASSG